MSKQEILETMEASKNHYVKIETVDGKTISAFVQYYEDPQGESYADEEEIPDAIICFVTDKREFLGLYERNIKSIEIVE